MSKICSKCKKEKEISEFYKKGSSKDGLTSHCKLCANKSVKKYYETNKDKILGWNKKYNKEHKDDRRDRHWKGTGICITTKEYELLFSKQSGVCAICGLPETSYDRKQGVLRKLAVDHDHKTGFIRGLLCHKCNVGIGHLQDDISILKSAIEYLEKFIEVANDKQR